MNAHKIRLIMALRRHGIVDTNVIAAMERVPREAFVPPAFRDSAYEDTALPISHGQTISQPMVVAAMTQALEVGDRHKVLEIGTGSGYQAAVLSRICRRVYSIERHRELLQETVARLEKLGYHNITARHGDGMLGWPAQAPFERMLVTAAGQNEDVPPRLLEQLADGGILIVPLQLPDGEQQVFRIQRRGDDFERTSLFPVRFVPLLPDVAEAEPRQAGAQS